MAPKGVRDVHPETFIKAYAAHLKANDKVHLQIAPGNAASLISVIESPGVVTVASLKAGACTVLCYARLARLMK